MIFICWRPAVTTCEQKSRETSSLSILITSGRTPDDGWTADEEKIDLVICDRLDGVFESFAELDPSLAEPMLSLCSPCCIIRFALRKSFLFSACQAKIFFRYTSSAFALHGDTHKTSGLF